MAKSRRRLIVALAILFAINIVLISFAQSAQ